MRLVIDSHIIADAYRNKKRGNSKCLGLTDEITEVLESLNSASQDQSPPRKIVVFLSYSHIDLNKVNPIYRHLKGKGRYEIFFDKESLYPGERWKAKLKEAIVKADLFLTFFSSDSTPIQNFHLKEFKWAEQHRRPDRGDFIIPVCLGRANIPEDFKGLQTIRLNQQNDLPKLVESIDRQSAVIDDTPKKPEEAKFLYLCVDDKDKGETDTYKRYESVIGTKSASNIDGFRKWYQHLRQNYPKAFRPVCGFWIPEDEVRVRDFSCRDYSDEVFLRVALWDQNAFLVTEAGILGKCSNGHLPADCGTKRFFNDMKVQVLSIDDAMRELSKLKQ